MLEVLTWLLAVELVGLLAFPIVFSLFHRLPDRGLAFAKPLGLALAGYCYWLMGMSRAVPNAQLTVAVILAALALASGWLVRRHAGAIKEFFCSQWRTVAVTEAVFLAFLALWLVIIAQIPAINHTEKPMDLAFLNAVLRSPHFPPEDPWLAGHPISYYYFGHLMMAFLVKLTAVPSSAGYNLAVALVAALTAAASFGLVHNLARLAGVKSGAALAGALLAPVLVTVLGNLEGVLEFARLQHWGGQSFWAWAGVKGLETGAAPGAGWVPQEPWWWWRATRVIDTVRAGESLDYTITEFPFFSFLLGDLHPHVMALPFVIMALGLALNLLLLPEPPGRAWLRRRPWELAAAAFCLGALAFINTWDFPMVAGLAGGLVLCRSLASRIQAGASAPAETVLLRSLGDTIMVLAPVLGAAIVLFLPFYLGLTSQASGLWPVTGPGTRPFHFLLVMGLPAFLGASLALWQLPTLSRLSRADAPAVALMAVALLAPLLLWVALAGVLVIAARGGGAFLAVLGSRMVTAAPGLALAGVAGYSAVQRLRMGNQPGLAFPLLLAAAAFFLLAGAELFYVVDFFGNRMNTVFKVYYQGWLLLALAGAFAIVYGWPRRTLGRQAEAWSRRALIGVAAVLMAGSLYYPLAAGLHRTGTLGSERGPSGSTLDGLAYLQDTDPGEYAAILWLRDQAPWGRLAEAVGEDYTSYGRVSSATGLPAVLGWKGHELQWRSGNRLFAGREADVARIYQTADPSEVAALLERYNIRYVYQGSREVASYGTGHLRDMGQVLRPVFSRDNVVVYERIDLAEQRGR
ncbi:MAG: hypothetical protein FJ316_10340 [SAR202 cluster bacterium]|nr:hypothetical protein [SAR202 cluster bacterium]